MKLCFVVTCHDFYRSIFNEKSFLFFADLYAVVFPTQFGSDFVKLNIRRQMVKLECYTRSELVINLYTREDFSVSPY